jgi:Heterokaryon incompatibility protein (HET)
LTLLVDATTHQNLARGKYVLRLFESRKCHSLIFTDAVTETDAYPIWSTPGCQFAKTSLVNQNDHDDAVDSTISNICRWLGDCCSFHERCSSNTSETALPKRVLDVGTLASPNLRMVQCSNEKTKYIALSYCWGLSGRVVASMQNLEELLHHIEENRLPRTFRNAISITRKLRIRYLWIDALCTIQDCRLDWEEQSAKMGDIYGNAYLTLSASKASDVSEGL